MVLLAVYPWSNRLRVEQMRESDMNEELKQFPITHAGIKPYMHPRLKAVIDGRTAIRYVRFLRPVKVERLELPKHTYGRWTPGVPVHPAHIIVSVLDRKSMRWKVVKEVEPERDPRISGEGLSQSMSSDEMEAFFRDVVKTTPPVKIELGGLETDHLRVECDREYPVWPNHGECNASIHSVPFGMFNTLKAFGEPLMKDIPNAEYLPILKQGKISPKAPTGMKVSQRGEMILFEGKRLSVGFALRRPIILHMGWDVLGKGLAGANRVSSRRVGFSEANRGVSGPLLVTLDGDYGSHHWTGEILVKGNKVIYKDLQCVPGVSVNAVFEVEPDKLIVQLTQQAEKDVPAIEAEAWRMAWSLRRGMTGVAGVPTLKPGRSGDVVLPAMIAGDCNGTLLYRVTGGDKDAVSLQTESYRPTNEVTSGIVLGKKPEVDECLVVPAKKVNATVEISVDNLQPDSPRGAKKPGPGVQRHWASNFSCYRPEWAGFSNHAASVNCHVNQHGPIEVAAFTKKPKGGPNPLDMARFTIGRGLMDGSAYGYWKNLYKDSDPVLVSAAGRLHQVEPDMKWLKSVEPGLVEATERMLETIGNEGLAICRDLSGNSGSYRWSSNAWDIVGFGHMDAYVNAWTYRAFRNAKALLAEVGRKDLARRCGDAAERLKANYAKHLVNSKTRWVVCWKSRDGELHDYASLWINGAACAFGVLEDKVAKKALGNLERLRREIGLQSAKLGLPFTLWPLKPEDHMMYKIMSGGKAEPTFEMFTDGSMAPSAIPFYLRALSIHGFKKEARQMAEDMDAGFAEGLFTGGAGIAFGDGNEFLSWEGLTAAYEGTFGPSFGVLYAVAAEQGVLKPPTPEWWPQGG
jgi:hypothetical protein